MQHFIIHKSKGTLTNTGKFRDHLDFMPDGRYLVTIKSTKTRSLQQNAYYHGVVVALVFDGLKAAGFDAVRNHDDAHEVLKALFLKTKEEKNGITIERIKSTTELNTTEFAEYVDAITVWAFDYLSVTIPAPGQALTLYQ